MKSIWPMYVALFCTCLWFMVIAEKPPKYPPDDMLLAFTADGAIPLANFYVDDTDNGNETHWKLSTDLLISYIKGAEKVFSRVSSRINQAIVSSTRLSTSDSDENGSGDPSTLMDNPRFIMKKDWVHYTLWRYRAEIKSSSVAVIGSADPWAEASALYLNASSVTTIEYNNLTYAHPNITTMSRYQFNDLYSCTGGYLETFDVALSISSFDHDGLGRYGDPLDPIGDLKAMKRAKSLLKPGGLLILTVPIGPDVIVFNLHRRYGLVRLPLLLDGWEIEKKLFWEEGKLTAEANWRQSYEPVLVLRKPLDDQDVATMCSEELEEKSLGFGVDVGRELHEVTEAIESNSNHNTNTVGSDRDSGAGDSHAEL